MSLTIKTLEHIFISKVRIKSLAYFLMNPDKPIHLRGAVRELKEEINAVRRELTRLEETKLIRSEAKGNRKYFELNGSHPFISELISIFHKSYGLGGEIINNEKKLGEIEYAFLTPSFTKGIFMGVQIIDMVIVGNVDLKVLDEIVTKAQYEFNKEIHYMVLKPSEFALRKRRRDQLLLDLMMQDLVLLLGNPDEFVKM
ncbi:MAG: hypothetical protein ABIM99_06465 [Candidatus Dojkabacteria bacterium]